MGRKIATVGTRVGLLLFGGPRRSDLASASRKQPNDNFIKSPNGHFAWPLQWPFQQRHPDPTQGKQLSIELSSIPRMIGARSWGQLLEERTIMAYYNATPQMNFLLRMTVGSRTFHLIQRKRNRRWPSSTYPAGVLLICIFSESVSPTQKVPGTSINGRCLPSKFVSRHFRLLRNYLATQRTFSAVSLAIKSSTNLIMAAIL